MVELQVGVKAVLRNREGRILLLKRSAAVYPQDMIAWDIPGGRIRAGRPLLEELRREVREETGLEFEGPELIAAQDILRTPGMHVVRLTYLARADGTPALSEENTESRWFSREELEKLEPLDRYLKAILEKIPRSPQRSAAADISSCSPRTATARRSCAGARRSSRTLRRAR